MFHRSGNRRKQFVVPFLLFLILALGTYLRLSAVTNTEINTPIRADAQVYYFSAVNLNQKGIFSSAAPTLPHVKPDAFVQPAFPFIIAPLIKFPPTMDMIFQVNILQAILGILTIILTFLFFLNFSEHSIALGAALLVAISPHLVVMTTYMLTETTFTFFLLLGFYLLMLAYTKEQPLFSIASGLALGLSALTRSTTEYLGLFLLLSFTFESKHHFTKTILPALLTSLTIIMGWKLRNLFAINSLSDPTLFINAVHHGMYPGFMYHGNPASLAIPYRFDPLSAWIDASAAHAIIAIVQNFAANPLQYSAWFFIGKPIFLLSWNMIDGIGDIFLYPVLSSPYFYNPVFQITRSIVFGLHGLLSIIAVFGLFFTLTIPKSSAANDKFMFAAKISALLVLYFFLIHIIGAPYPRYGIPLRPFIYGFGLLFIHQFFRKMFAMKKKGSLSR